MTPPQLRDVQPLTLIRILSRVLLVLIGVGLAFALYRAGGREFFSWSVATPYSPLVAVLIGGVSAALVGLWLLTSSGKFNYPRTQRLLVSTSLIWLGFGAGLFGPAALGREGSWETVGVATIADGRVGPTGLYRNEGIELYLGSKSFEVGDEIPVFVNSPNAGYSLEVVRFGMEDELVLNTAQRNHILQKSRVLAHEFGAGWNQTDQIETSGLEPGVYGVRGTDGASSFESIFCLKSPKGRGNELALLLNTNTWAAYNSWGGASLYRWNLPFDTERAFAERVSFLRPNPAENSRSSTSDLFGGELHLLRWLEGNDIDYGCLTDDDLHSNPSILSGSTALILNTHPEYWSTQMYDNLEAFLDSGGSLLNLGGNGVYWKTEITDDGIFVDKTGRIEGQGLWREVGRPESAVLGVRYDEEGYNTYAPYEVLVADHWVFEDLGLTNGDLFGSDSLVTAISGESGASGWETDKTDEFSPANGIVIARGTNSEGPAELFFYEHSGGGSVLSFGSLTSASAVPGDESMSGIVLNFLKRIGVNFPL